MMYHSDAEYPYSHENLPELDELLQNIDWDVLCVFDACRWDVFEEVAEESEPVQSPGSNTPTWTQSVWIESDYDWSDVTYISGNGVTTNVRNNEDRGGKIEEHVGEYIEAFNRDDVWGDYVSTAKPDKLTELAFDYEPPIVIHYTQPHTPFIGSVSLRVNGNWDDLPVGGDSNDQFHTAQEYQMVKEDLVSPEYARLAYRKNAELVWDESREIRQEFDQVLTTADHGEKLGPDKWDHGGPRRDEARIVPLHANWEVELPAPESVGASESFSWQVYEQASTDGGMGDHWPGVIQPETWESPSEALDDLEKLVDERVQDPASEDNVASISGEILREAWAPLFTHYSFREVVGETTVSLDFHLLLRDEDDPSEALETLVFESLREHLVAAVNGDTKNEGRSQFGAKDTAATDGGSKSALRPIFDRLEDE